jgi:hypothetical protein
MRNLFSGMDVSVVAILVALVGLAGRPASAQQMSFSVYLDVDSNGSTVWGYSDIWDDSWGCSHSNYSFETALWGPTGYNSSAGSSTSLAFAEGDFTVQGSVTYHCSCIASFTVYSSALTWHLGFRYTYYTNVQPAPPWCYWSSLACSSGTPSCNNGIGLYVGGAGCSNFARATWLVAVRGATTQCLTYHLITPTGGPGQCT